MKNSKIKAIIFDMDGVLVDTEPLHYIAWRKTLKKYRYKLTKKEFIMDFVGVGKEICSDNMSKKLKIPKNEILKERNRMYRGLMKNAKEKKGAIKLVMRLRKNFKVCVATSSKKDEALFVLRNVKLSGLFKKIVTGSNVKRLKPYPDIYLFAAKKIKVKSRECIAIEDTEVGILAAKRAGMKCIAVPHEFSRKQDFSLADKVIKSLSLIDDKLIQSL